MADAYASLYDPSMESFTSPAKKEHVQYGRLEGAQGKGDPFGPSELKPSNPALTSAGFGFENTGAPQALPEAWRQLLQPLFEPYGVDLSQVRVQVTDLGGNWGVYPGGNTIQVDRSRLFALDSDGATVADTLAHEISHIYQARILRVGPTKMGQLINIETTANRTRGVEKYYYPDSFNLPRPNRLPGAVSLEGIASRFGAEGQRLWKAAIW